MTAPLLSFRIKKSILATSGTDHVVISETKGPLGRDWHAYVVPAEQIPADERDRLITKRLPVAEFDMTGSYLSGVNVATR